MNKRYTVPGELCLAAGMLLISFSISLMVRADLGISTISSLPYALSFIIDDVSFGTWNIVFQVSLLVLLVAITKRFKTGYVIAFILSMFFGLMLDVFVDALVGIPDGLWLRLLYFAVSYPIMCLGISMMINSMIPLMIVDMFINDLTQHFHVTYRRMKTAFDISCLSLSIILPLVFLGNIAGVGIGTVLMAITTGAGVHAVNGVLARYVVIRPWSEALAKMAR